MAFKMSTLMVMTSILGFAAAAPAAPSCAPSASVLTSNYPGAKSIPSTNNLLQPTGKAAPADGQKLIITGRVLDSDCAVVPNAVVELWQVSPFGRWLLAGADDLSSPNAIFAGAGRTYTNGDGMFSFITAFPAPAAANRAPFVNIRIKAPGISGYSTALYFSGDVRNDADAGYKKLPAAARNNVTVQMHQDDDGTLAGTVELVLTGKAPYRTY